MVRLGEFALTYNGHCGFIEKIYHVTGRGEYCYIRESDGRLYYCPTSMLLMGGGDNVYLTDKYLRKTGVD